MLRGMDAALTAGVLLAAALPAAAQDVPWRLDYPAARREAKELNRPIVMDLGAENCVWCKRLDATTFRDPAVAKLLRERFVAIKVDAGQQAALAQALGVQSYPTLVFAAPDGKILGKHEGYVEPQRFVQQLQKTLAAVETAPAPAAAAGPLPPWRAGLTQLAAQVPDDPEQLLLACNDLAAALATVQLQLAESLLRAGQQRQAASCFQKVIQASPGSQQALAAQTRLRELEAALAAPVKSIATGN